MFDRGLVHITLLMNLVILGHLLNVSRQDQFQIQMIRFRKASFYNEEISTLPVLIEGLRRDRTIERWHLKGKESPPLGP